MRSSRFPVYLVLIFLIVREDIASRCKKIRERREFLAAARSIQSREQANLEQTTIEVTEHKPVLFRTGVKWKLTGMYTGKVLMRFRAVFHLYEHPSSRRCQGYFLLSYCLPQSCYLLFSLFRYLFHSSLLNPPHLCRSLPIKRSLKM